MPFHFFSSSSSSSYHPDFSISSAFASFASFPIFSSQQFNQVIISFLPFQLHFCSQNEAKMKLIIFFSSLLAALASAAPKVPATGIFISVRQLDDIGTSTTFPVPYGILTKIENRRHPFHSALHFFFFAKKSASLIPYQPRKQDSNSPWHS